MTAKKGSGLVVMWAMMLLIGNTLAYSQTGSNTSNTVTPAEGTWAGGADFGFVNPLGDNDLDGNPFFSGYLERFMTPHLSWRGTLALYSFDGPTIPAFPSADVDVLAVMGNLVYQWEGGKTHPFVTAGIGLYDRDADFGDSDLETGVNFGGGVNFYLKRDFAIKLEGLFHGTTGSEPDSLFTGTVGARWLW